MYLFCTLLPLHSSTVSAKCQAHNLHIGILYGIGAGAGLGLAPMGVPYLVVLLKNQSYVDVNLFW